MATNILESISTYDSDSHIAYPTLDYILEETGEDLKQASDNDEDAVRRLKHMTKTAKRFLMCDKIFDTQKKLEYLIATDEDYRREWLEYVASFVHDVLLTGANVLNVPQGQLQEVLTAKTRAFLESGLLNVKQFGYLEYTYHSGY